MGNQGYFADRFDYLYGWTYNNDFNRRPLTAASVAVGSDLDWAVAGTNAVDGSFALSATGGITGTTTTAANDQVILVPHTTSNQSNLNTAGLFVTDAQPYFETVIKTGSTISSTRIWAGLKLTSTGTIATDNDGLFFIYDSAVETNWRCVVAINGTQTSYTLPTPAPIPAVAVSTVYKLRCWIDANRYPYAEITLNTMNTSSSQGNHVAFQLPQSALLTGANLKPFVGIQTLTTAARAMDVKTIYLERKYV